MSFVQRTEVPKPNTIARGNPRPGYRFRLGWVVLLAAITSVTGTTAHAADKLSPRQINEIKQLSAEMLAKEGLPGLSVAVAKGDQVLRRSSAGPSIRMYSDQGLVDPNESIGMRLMGGT